MKLYSLFAAAGLLAASAPAFAQTWISDSVVTGANYNNDVFYTLPTGAKVSSANTNWDLAFEMTPYGPYGQMSVLANHAQDTVSVYSLHLAASTSFATLGTADTAGLTGDAHKLYNNPENWSNGAFNRNNNPSNPFDFSWGLYNMSTHKVVGDSLYLVTINNTAYKLWIQEYNSVPVTDPTWTFRIASWDNTMDTTIVVHGADYTERNFAYFSIKDLALLDREPSNQSWELLFTRYVDTASMPGFGTLMYPVTGVLLNHGVVAAKVTGTAPDAATDTAATYTSRTNVIGYDWKHNAMGAGFVIDTTTSYFVRALDSTYWQVVFTGFSGKSTGTYQFKKRMLTTTGIATTNQSKLQVALAPQPANNLMNLMVDAPQSDAVQLLLVDMNGRTVMQNKLSLQAGMNAFSFTTGHLPGGLYMLQLTGKNFRHAQKVLVAH